MRKLRAVLKFLCVTITSNEVTMLIRKLSAVAALSGFAMFATPAIAEDAELKELLMKQQKQIEALQ
ncbi:MAG: hypothetical protein NE328_09705, partial [Lentisphaeraceae bacterium]|nr:hypothetical protein [Lentisphaeraceae bacterium]